METIRPPAVAGSFYPDDPAELARSVANLLARAGDRLAATPPPGHPGDGEPHPVVKALIVPHAGYIYSGSTAALGYALLAEAAGTIERVVLLGPSHRVAVRGLALPTARVFATPLGPLELDRLEPGLAAGLPQLVVDDAAHAREHSLEVQLPFLRTVLPDVRLVPLSVGSATADEVGEVLDALWGGVETVLVISSDLSHYLPYPQARAADDVTIEQILELRGPLAHDQACGATPINGLLVSAARRGLRPRLLGACSSGDTAGDRSRVVGYAAVALEQPDAPG